jgi:hypothetical protein
MKTNIDIQHVEKITVEEPKKIEVGEKFWWIRDIIFRDNKGNQLKITAYTEGEENTLNF